MTDNEREKIWNEFLATWPRERIAKMALQEYSAIGSRDSFTSWLESRTQDLGSIWGGSSFKFGIYERGNSDSEISDPKYAYDSKYAWRAKFGATPKEAFEKVRREILRIVDASGAGNISALGSGIVWPIVAKKIAYLYQNQNRPFMVGIFKPDVLKVFLGMDKSRTVEMDDLYRLAMEKRGDKSLVAFTREIWEKGNNGKIEEDSVEPLPEEKSQPEMQPDKKALAAEIPLNQILYGPPGTGKTYATIDRALEIFRAAGVETGSSREEQLVCYEKLRDSRHIRFVTFHQSFSYEDFVEGIRATPEDGAIRYEVVNGIFREICEDAQRKVERQGKGRFQPGDGKVWKMSLGDTTKDDDWVFEFCKDNNCLLMGYGGDVDFANCGSWQDVQEAFEKEFPEQLEKNGYPAAQVSKFVCEMKPGDLVVISAGNSRFRALGIVGGNYRVIDNRTDPGAYRQCRDVEWVYFCEPAQQVETIYTKRFSQQTLYSLNPAYIDRAALERLLDGARDEVPLPYVLIIDEINRGNISAIFGELITLLEESHRANGPEPLSVTLPYSRDSFSMPGNIYLIGTMNTADRSLTRLDSALRRRFSMISMPPRSDLLQDIKISSTGISLGGILGRINERISILLDKEHCIGHAPFMDIPRASSKTELLNCLRRIFLGYVVPLLEEYFFDDWEKIALVLNDQSKPDREKMVKKMDISKIFPNSSQMDNGVDSWKWNETAFDDLLSYAHIYDAKVNEPNVERPMTPDGIPDSE